MEEESEIKHPDVFKEARIEMCVNPLSLDEILEKTLKLLPMKALNRVFSVSKQWQSIANRLKTSRQQIAGLVYSEKGKDGDSVDVQIGRHLEVFASQPAVALVFCSSALHRKSVSFSAGNHGSGDNSARANKREKLSFVCCLRRLLPSNCHLLGIVTDGIVGTHFDSNLIVELENSKAASVLLLPKLQDVDIYSFKLPANSDDSPEDGHEDQLNSNNAGSNTEPNAKGTKELSPTEVDEKTQIPGGKNVRLVLLFMTEMNSTVSEFGRALVRRYGANAVVVAGGFGDSAFSLTGQIQPGEDDDLSDLGIAFCSDRLHVASVVLPAHMYDPKEVENCLRKLLAVPTTAQIPSSKNSFGLMFACMGRGERFYDGQANVESSTFSRLFPGIPLVGFFGNGEIGFEFPPGITTAAGEGSDSGGAGVSAECPKLYHSYTTIFVLVTLC